jgi:hypothetical protein
MPVSDWPAPSEWSGMIVSACAVWRPLSGWAARPVGTRRRRARSPREPAAGSREKRADGHGCTALHHKTHSIGSGDEVAIAYAWHPWAGRLVHVREVIERTTGVSARCGLVDVAADRVQEIPVWMLDAAICRSMRASDGSVAALPALRTLRSLLSEAMKRTPAVSSPDPQIASPDCHRGDRHAPPALSASKAGPPTRPVPIAPSLNVDSGAGVERPARADTASRHRADEPPVGGPRRRRRAPAGERRR